jgi:chemotaxis protein methyltransferase CheR
MMPPEDEVAFRWMTRRVSRQAGLSLDSYKDKCLRRRIAVRMRACGAQNYAEYLAILERDPEEYQRLRDAITINVTSFYRNPETWNQIRAVVVPEVCTPSRSEARAWSAGCASGEEPYTLAMLVADHVAGQGRPERLARFSVDATDIDQACLARAKAACYRREALAGVPADWEERYFEIVSGEYRIIERIRRQVSLATSDLCRDAPPRAEYHLILCRNVIIYFERAAQERVFSLFAEALAPGGFLVLGKVESLSGRARDQFTLVDPRERIYRRLA